MIEVGLDDKMKIGSCMSCIMDPSQEYYSENITGPEEKYTISLDRKVSYEAIKNLQLEKMPGFRVKWIYNVTPILNNLTEMMYKNEVATLEFVR